MGATAAGCGGLHQRGCAVGWGMDTGGWVVEVARVNDEVLDVRETAMLLGLPEEVVIDEAAMGNLPGRQIGGNGAAATPACSHGCAAIPER
jgi:hypothetical protein